MEVLEILKGEWDEIKGLALPFLTFIIINALDPKLGLKVRIGETAATFVYGIATLLLWIIGASIVAGFDGRRVKIYPAPSYSEYMSPPFNGIRHYAVLNVEIPRGWEITDCYVSLEKDIMIYNEDRILLEPQFATWFAEKTKPEYKMLRWKTPLDSSYKITIGENSNAESVLVADITIGTAKDVHNIDAEIKTLEFCFCSNPPRSIKFNRLGLRRISLALHWKRNGKKRTPRAFEGYIYSEVNGQLPKLIFQTGDYATNEHVPKPLPKSV